MFKMKFQTITIAAVIASLLLIGVNSSEAASITSLSVSSGTDYGGGATATASLSTDEDIYTVALSVKQTYPKDEEDSEYTLVYQNTYSAGTTSVYADLGLFDGHIKIAAYDVEAEVTFWDAENETFTSDTSSASTSVSKPVVDDSGYKETGVYGYAELSSHYYDGSYIVMDGYVWAHNGTGNNARGFGRFRHTAQNKPLDELEKDLPNETFRHGDSYGYNTSHWGTYFNYFSGRLEGGDTWKCDAYLRLKVHQGVTDDWEATGFNIFTKDDNR